MARKKKKKVLWSIFWAGVLAVFAISVYHFYIFIPANVVKSGKLYIPSGATYQQLTDSLKPFLKRQNTFLKAAKIKGLSKQVHPGRYTLKKGMSNNDIIDMLRSGNQDEIAIRIGNYSSIYELAGRVAPFLQCDSQQIVEGIIHSDFARGSDSDDWLYFFIPNTYFFHWNLTGSEFAEKMKSYFDKFWTPERLAAAKAEKLTPLQVTILASIVQLESKHPDEQPRVARLYLNRLQNDMRLDADPTVIFAMRQTAGNNMKVERVYYKNLQTASPYNTYRHDGLPPGPICMPNASAVDAVLHPADNDYLYFVADPSHPGYHIYAHTLAEQDANAKKYKKWIDSVQKQNTPNE